MKNKKLYVVFSETNARVVVNPSSIPIGAMLVSPNDLPKNTPPHFWKKENGKIVAMSKKEKAERLKQIPKEVQIKNSVIRPIIINAICLVTGIIIGALAWQQFN